MLLVEFLPFLCLLSINKGHIKYLVKDPYETYVSLENETKRE